MKKFLAIIISVIVALTASAQEQFSIILDQSSFHRAHSDALTGVNIDPIRKDSSRDACARVKIRFANMSRAEIDALSVKFRSNTELVRQQVAQYFDNVLILEMTAKPNTRFYVQSPEYGQSNEISVNLDGDFEYEMEARLNQSFSIVVNTNVDGAEVYVDDAFKGRTGANGSLTISDVMIGSHTLKLTYGGIVTTEQIDVNKGSIHFSHQINKAASRPQFVVFVVEPANAVVTIEGKHYTLEQGAMQVLLENGSYNYTVSAVGYHSQSGTITVAGSKIEESFSLKADSANVTITAPNGTEIWINGVKRGTGSWSGTLNSGTYIFEARKEGHQTTSISRNITSAVAVQSYSLPAPTPMVGILVVTATPIMADVAVDGKAVGRAPIELSDMLVGSHTLKISKAGYNDYTQTVVVAEGKITTINATLNKITTPQYNIGDIVTIAGVQGIVFQTSPVVKIVSVKSTTAVRGPENAITNAVEAYNGKINSDKIRSLSDWRTKYPAFRWCADLGEGWYLPATEELKAICKHDFVINKRLKSIHMPELGLGYLWASNEIGNGVAFLFNLASGGINSSIMNKQYGVRAVRVIEGTAASTSSAKVYKVGDYYSENGLQGVVFEVSADGKSGKIVSMKQSGAIAWTMDSNNQNRKIYSTSWEDGALNMPFVKLLPSWQAKFPAFKWCADLGSRWYLPAYNEVKLFTLDDAVRDAVNRTLIANGGVKIFEKGSGTGYWSSSEDFENNKVFYVSMNAVDAYRVSTKSKGSTLYVRAIATFGMPSTPPAPAGVTLSGVDYSISSYKLYQQAFDYYNSGNYDSALKYYYVAAMRDNSAAMSDLGFFYYFGLGVTKDYAAALYWHRKSAELGSPNGQNNLADHYENGFGVTKDLEMALYWYRKAAAQGDESAKRSVQKLEPMVSGR